MRLPRYARWYAELVEAEGMAVHGYVRNKHLKITVRRADGKTKLFTVGASSSDHRAHLNARQLLRAFAKEPA
ncbi:MAG: hypothetical protein GX856_03245 [Gammaproteobacteria bacterium]|nr:hypothetical protein [Gammaproteobacteria bacterium]